MAGRSSAGPTRTVWMGSAWARWSSPPTWPEARSGSAGRRPLSPTPRHRQPAARLAVAILGPVGRRAPLVGLCRSQRGDRETARGAGRRMVPSNVIEDLAALAAGELLTARGPGSMRLIHTSLATGLDMPGRKAPPGGWRRVRVPTG